MLNKINFIIFFSLINIIASNNTFAEVTKFDSLINKGINEIYNIKFEEAEKTFAEVQKLYPQHPAGKFFDAMIMWWKIMLDMNNEEFDDIFEEKLEEVIDFCEEILDEDEENVDALFFKGGALGFRGRLYSIRKNWFDAALDGKEALPLVFEAYKIDPTNEDVKLGFGIYNYYAEAIPEKYPFIKPAMIFLPKGDKKKGLVQLKVAAEKAKYAKIEAKYFLLNVYYQFENKYSEALNYAEELHYLFPDNPIFEKYLGRIFIKKNNYNEAAKYFYNIKQKCENNFPGYNDNLLREASYYLGVNYLRHNKIDSSEYSFEQCYNLSLKLDEDKDEASGFQISALIYLAKINLRQGRTKKAKEIYEEILDKRDYNHSHEKAKKYLNRLKS